MEEWKYMSVNHCPTEPYRILARAERGWHILHLDDDRVQFDFGPFAMAVSRTEFQLLHGLAEAAATAATRSGCLAQAGPVASAWRDPQSNTVMLVYGGSTILRFQPPELEALVRLYRVAGTILGEQPCRLPSSESAN